MGAQRKLGYQPTSFQFAPFPAVRWIPIELLESTSRSWSRRCRTWRAGYQETRPLALPEGVAGAIRAGVAFQHLLPRLDLVPTVLRHDAELGDVLRDPLIGPVEARDPLTGRRSRIGRFAPIRSSLSSATVAIEGRTVSRSLNMRDRPVRRPGSSAPR